jgi:hypothetical protein
MITYSALVILVGKPLGKQVTLKFEKEMGG